MAEVPRLAIASVLGTALLATAYDAAAQTPPAQTPWLRDAMSPQMRSDLDQTPAFLRDTKLGLNLRTYFRDNEASEDVFQRAWAGGGSLTYHSGWLADLFAIGGAFYTSLPIWAPEEHDGTKLLAPGQSPINVVGEAFAKLRYDEHLFTGWRQKIDVGYVNPQDNRMVPNTFEAAMLTGKVAWVDYAAGFLWGMKIREGTKFVPLSQVAGAHGSDEPGYLWGVELKPWEPLSIELNGIYVNDVLGTTFANGEYVHKFSDALLGAFGLQYTDQRSLGSNLIGDFETWNAGGRVRGLWHGVGLELALSQTGDDANIASPFGSFPGYLSLVNKDFNTAGQTAWGVKLTNDFRNVGVPGLTGFIWYADGNGAVSPATGADANDFRELDLSLTYAPTRDVFGGKLYGFSIRGAVALVDIEGNSNVFPDYRIIVNYAIPLL